MKTGILSHGFILALLVSPLSAGSFTLTPDEDTDLYQFFGYPTTTIHSLGVTVNANGGHSQKTLIRFSVASAKFTAENLESATLRLNILPAATVGNPLGGSFAPGIVEVFYQGQPWAVETARWSSASAGDLIGNIAITKASTESKQVWVEMDATAAVKAWLSGSANHGFLLQGADEFAEEQLSVSFASMETGYQPELVIVTAEDPPPPPPPEVDKHTRPKLKINRSVPSKVTTKRALVRGRSSGSDNIEKVRYRIGSGPYRTATGTAKWKFKAKLAKGKNVIRIFAKDDTGDRSKILKLKIKRVPKKKK